MAPKSGSYSGLYLRVKLMTSTTWALIKCRCSHQLVGKWWHMAWPMLGLSDR